MAKGILDRKNVKVETKAGVVVVDFKAERGRGEITSYRGNEDALDAAAVVVQRRFGLKCVSVAC